MARIVLGHRDGALAIRLARTVLTDLAAEWPDLQFVPRTFGSAGPEDGDAVLNAVIDGRASLAVVAGETLRAPLPEGLALAAVTRRVEPRLTLVTKGSKRLEDLSAGARLGVGAERDLPFVHAGFPGAEAELLTGGVEAALKRLAADEFEGLLLPASTLVTLDLRDRVGVLLEPDVVPPAPGQGTLALVARSDDDVAAEVAYTLQHRPSFDRVRAERAFAAGLVGFAVGALATVNDDGDLTLFGAVARGTTTLQASVSGDAKEATELGAELAKDVRTQLEAL
ncbi:hydroxymethylbilane synthase [soil metagenome]